MEQDKNKTSWIWVTLAVVVVVIIIIVGVVTPKNDESAQSEDGPIKIGVIAPLSGDAAIYGEPIRNALQIATEDINAKGGIDGRLVEIIYEDGKCTGKDASLAAQKLVSVDKVQVVVGGACSGETLPAATVTEPAKVVLISPGASAPAVSQAGDYVFRTIPSDLAASKKISDMMKDAGFKNIAIISEQTDYSQGLRGSFVENSENNGLNVVYDDSFPSDTVEFKAFASKIVSSDADVIFLNPQTGASAARIAKAIRDQGGDMPFYGYFITGDDFVKSGRSVEGAIVLDYAPAGNKTVGDILLETYTAKFGEAPSYPLFVNSAYDTVNIIFQAIDRVGYDATKIRDYLYKMPPHEGILIPNLTFDKNGDPLGNAPFVIKEVRGGGLVEIGK